MRHACDFELETKKDKRSGFSLLLVNIFLILMATSSDSLSISIKKMWADAFFFFLLLL
jgi:hypothetical protein